MIPVLTLEHLLKNVEFSVDMFLWEKDSSKLWKVSKAEGVRVWHMTFQGGDSDIITSTYFSRGDLYWDLATDYLDNTDYLLFEKETEEDIAKIKMGFELLR